MKVMITPLKDRVKNLDEIETRLEKMFVQVVPRPEFVWDLRQRLMAQFTPRAQVVMNDQRTVLIIAASLLSFMMVLMVSLRTVLAVLTSLELLYQYRHHLHREKRRQVLPPAV